MNSDLQLLRPEDFPPLLQEISDPPDWLSQLVNKLSSHKKSIPLTDVMHGAEEGNRNMSAAVFIGHLLSKTAEELWEISCWPTLCSRSTSFNINKKT